MVGQDGDEEFRANSGRVMGTMAVVAGVAVLVLGLVEGGMPVWGWPAAGLWTVLAWATMLRPRVAITSGRLELTNAFSTVRIPLAAIEQSAVRQVLAVRVGERRYVSSAIGRSLRKVVRGTPTRADAPPSEIDYADHVEQRLAQRCEDARSAAGIRLLSDEQEALGAEVRRDVDLVPVGLVVLCAAALLVTVLL